MKPEISIPPFLAEEAARGGVALFFGAGASRAAGHPDPKVKMPLGTGLRDILSDEFLNGDSKDRALSEVASFIELDAGRLRVDAHIAKLMRPFIPSAGHNVLPTFRWQALYSLNYDRLIEDAYAKAGGPLQSLHVFHKSEEAIDRTLRNDPGSVGLFKLHGCIDRLNDPQAPLILSQESYLVWHEGRERLYSRLADSVAEYPVVFIGTTLADPHIAALLSKATSKRPMQYIVSPNLSDRDVALFSSKRIHPIRATFDDFMTAMDGAIDPVKRRIARSLSATAHPITRHFRTKLDAPASLVAFLENNVDYVSAGVRTDAVSADLFFKGMSQSWSPIEQKLDIQRTVYEAFMLKTLELQAKDGGIDVIALRGVAGSGKTVFSRRAAYDLATTYDHLVLYAPPRANLRAEALRDLFELTGKRAVLVVDQAADQMSRIGEIIDRLASWGVPLTVILADSQAAFGMSLDDLGEIVRFTYDLRQLSEHEIKLLIGKLEVHNCLGILRDASEVDRISSFTKAADRQLLVALYEATQGKPLEEILVEEYHRIALTDAQELYLVVCTLNQYNVPVRAGLIRRLTGIDFNEFKSRLLGPLSDVVFASIDPISRDYTFRTRHPQIAQIVFKNILDTNSKKVNQFIRLITQMDTSYSSDLEAMKKMVNYKNIRDAAPILKDRREILEVAETVTKGETFALQQRALVEMNDSKGDLAIAREYLDRAEGLRPNDRSLKHSRATLLAREAQAAPNNLARKVLRTEAMGVLKSLRRDATDPYIASSTAQLIIDDIVDRIASDDRSESTDAQLLRLVDEGEQAIRAGLSKAPDFEGLTLAASKLHEVVGRDKHSVAVLKRAIDARPQLEFVAIAYARAIKGSDLPGALTTIKKSLIHTPHSKPLNQTLFELMLLEADDARQEMLLPLRRAFTDHDNNVAMHIHMVRYFFLRGDLIEYESARAVAKTLQVQATVKHRPRFQYRNPASKDGLFDGQVTGLSGAYAFVKVPGMTSDVFLSPGIGIDIDAWDNLGKGQQVRFGLAFNALGAVGLSLTSS